MHIAAGVRDQNRPRIARRTAFDFERNLSVIDFRHDERLHPFCQITNQIFGEGPRGHQLEPTDF